MTRMRITGTCEILDIVFATGYRFIFRISLLEKNCHLNGKGKKKELFGIQSLENA